MTPAEPEQNGSGHGHVQATRPGPVVFLGVIALIGGWALRPVMRWFGETPPVVGWVQVGALFFVAAVLAVVAYQTRQAVARPLGMEPHRAVNRLVLAKACILVGAVVAGGYGGYALTWIDSEAVLAGQRILRSGLGALAGLLVIGAALLLERACRVRDDEEPPPGLEV